MEKVGLESGRVGVASGKVHAVTYVLECVLLTLVTEVMSHVTSNVIIIIIDR